MTSPKIFHSVSPDKILSEYLSAEQLARCCDQIWSADRRSPVERDSRTPRHRSIVYAKRDHVGGLFKKLRHRRARVVLVTAESDDAVFANEQIPPQVAAWFSTNSRNPQVTSLPLGLGNSYCNVTTKIADLVAAHRGTKSHLLYLNFRPSTNPTIRWPLWEAYEGAERAGWASRRPGDMAGREYALELARHQFSLCPAGNGVDTHRLWESLYAGTIPVVLKDPALEAFVDLPILFVDDLTRLEQAFLEDQAVKFRNRSDWNLKKLFVPFWRDQFECARANIGRPLSVTAFLASMLKFPSAWQTDRTCVQRRAEGLPFRKVK